MQEKLIVALDLPTITDAYTMAIELNPVVQFFKVGFGLMFEPGFDDFLVYLQNNNKKIFLDAKLYDIPQTVGRAVASASRRKVDFITVHGDKEIMKAAVENRGSTKIFAVTALTSLDDDALRDLGFSMSVQELVKTRTKMAFECGCDGIIASASDDLTMFKKYARKDFMVATPGIRFKSDSKNDHKRAASPSEAISNGVDYIIVGRSIIDSKDPLESAKQMILEMSAT